MAVAHRQAGSGPVQKREVAVVKQELGGSWGTTLDVTVETGREVKSRIHHTSLVSGPSLRQHPDPDPVSRKCSQIVHRGDGAGELASVHDSFIHKIVPGTE